MRVLVCGGRNFMDYILLERTLDELHAIYKFEIVMHGGARGADTFADNWAYSRQIKIEKHPALWKTHGRAAGPIRNREMLARHPDLVVAFPGGVMTADMVQIARDAGIEVIELAARYKR